MKTLKIEAEFTYDEEMMHSGEDDPDAKKWFFEDILTEKLEVFSLEIGDYIGTLVIKCIELYEK